jgi:hypothetical protein
MSWFNFVKRTDNVGVGTMDLGLLPTHSLPLYEVTGPGWRVQGQLFSQAPAYIKIGRSVVPVSILGTNGLAVPDQMTLQQLAYQERQRG